jgi:hypothetical protein
MRQTCVTLRFGRLNKFLMRMETSVSRDYGALIEFRECSDSGEVVLVLKVVQCYLSHRSESSNAAEILKELTALCLLMVN